MSDGHSGDKPDHVPDHYEEYECPECGQGQWTAPRAEETSMGVWCVECGETIAGGTGDNSEYEMLNIQILDDPTDGGESNE